MKAVFAYVPVHSSGYYRFYGFIRACGRVCA
jgi:hypothetical protein